jgi:hypothetical protein
MVKLLIPYTLLFFSHQGLGQISERLNKNPERNSDTTGKELLVTQQINYLKTLYYKEISAPKEILNGEEYLLYFFQSKTNPLFYSRDKFNATLYINNRQYRNIKLQYDTYLDDIIYTDTSKIINYEYPRIALNKDIVDGFSLFINGDSLKFRHLRFPSNSGDKLEDGYYEIVYDGPSKYIIKHRSELYRRESLNEYKYAPVNYISTGDKFYDIRDNKNFNLIFGDRSQEIKEFLHKSRIRLKRADKNEIRLLLAYYDSIKTAGK